MKFGIDLYLWADDVHDGLMPVLENLKQIGLTSARSARRRGAGR